VYSRLMSVMVDAIFGTRSLPCFSYEKHRIDKTVPRHRKMFNPRGSEEEGGQGTNRSDYGRFSTQRIKQKRPFATDVLPMNTIFADSVSLLIAPCLGAIRQEGAGWRFLLSS